MGSSSKIIIVLCVVGVIGASVMYSMMSGNDNSDDRHAYLQHGRMALRVDHLHTTRTHHRVGKACDDEGGVEVSGISLGKIEQNDGMLFWKSKSDPYVTLTIGGFSQETKIKKDTEKASFDGVFCFKGEKLLEAFNSDGLMVTALDSDKGELLAGKDDQLGSLRVTTAGTITKDAERCKITVTIKVVQPKKQPAKYCAHRCKEPRVRKDFALLTDKERATYVKAVKEAKAAGIYEDFVKVHTEHTNDQYAHSTAGFLPWHRKFLIEYENALRCLGEEYKCVTIPYWDWAEWSFFCNLEPGGCKSYADVPATMKAELGPNAKNILAEFGGPGTKGKMTQGAKRTWGSTGHPAGVGCVTTGPFSDWVDWEGHCLSRGSDWGLPHSKNRAFTNMNYLVMIMAKEETYGPSRDWSQRGYRSQLQNQPHNNQHNYLGGHMRSMRSPFDPIFFSHHAMVDKQWARWQDCHDHETVGTDKSGFEKKHYQGNGEGRGTVDSGIDVSMPFNLPYNNFKRQDGKKYVGQDKGLGYAWDHDRQGSRPRDWLIVADKFPGSPYHYQWDSFQKIIAESCSMSGGGPGATKLGEKDPVQATQRAQTSFIEEHLVAEARTGSIVSFEHFTKIVNLVKDQLRGKGVDVESKEGKKKVIKTALTSEAKDQCARSAKTFGTAYCDCNKPTPDCEEDCNFNERFGTGDPPEAPKLKDFCTGKEKTHKEMGAEASTQPIPAQKSGGKK